MSKKDIINDEDLLSLKERVTKKLELQAEQVRKRILQNNSVEN